MNFKAILSLSLFSFVGFSSAEAIKEEDKKHIYTLNYESYLHKEDNKKITKSVNTKEFSEMFMGDYLDAAKYINGYIYDRVMEAIIKLPKDQGEAFLLKNKVLIDTLKLLSEMQVNY